MTEDTVRLAKRVAEHFHCSRADATHYIEGGWVKVDGNIIEEPGFRVRPQAQLELQPDAVAEPAQAATFLLHKPSGMDAADAVQLVTPDNRSADDRSGFRFLKRHLADLSNPAPLETEASGLLVLTQDWRVKRKLTEDASRIEHEIIVDVAGAMIPEGLAQLNRSLIFQGKALPPMKVSWQNEARLRFAVMAPPSGLIAHACALVGLTPRAVRRIRLGRLPMAGLQPGQWRYVQDYERF
ncbi:rRNA pseudouridine synthase [Noviherbaspirillum sedimenti]|uniref:Dual-specificity RNA pseudouridine synthase RluF n=1 Tax=Noviherbaspirillum sedimenti TaxID=2320865 RepID=A0A3A3G7W1_9BURK|nr:rRNA pseudouridine synthase [Noviherbaspirillum sedimenti]RJG04597.1 RNA-binding protein [Noviherbaspirillum sedimenti]